MLFDHADARQHLGVSLWEKTRSRNAFANNHALRLRKATFALDKTRIVEAITIDGLHGEVSKSAITLFQPEILKAIATLFTR